ncbi:MAG: hypothetical protein C0494_15835 [Sphingobium sp.]|nr:hypothetical protein [Sphingobium sp.]
MAMNVISFPVRSVIPALNDACTDIEEARHMVARLRTQRDACHPHSRQFMVEQIKLDWWMDELMRVSVVADSNVIVLRRVTQ